MNNALVKLHVGVTIFVFSFVKFLHHQMFGLVEKVLRHLLLFFSLVQGFRTSDQLQRILDFKALHGWSCHLLNLRR